MRKQAMAILLAVAQALAGCMTTFDISPTQIPKLGSGTVRAKDGSEKTVREEYAVAIVSEGKQVPWSALRAPNVAPRPASSEARNVWAAPSDKASSSNDAADQDPWIPGPIELVSDSSNGWIGAEATAAPFLAASGQLGSGTATPGALWMFGSPRGTFGIYPAWVDHVTIRQLNPGKTAGAVVGYSLAGVAGVAVITVVVVVACCATFGAAVGR